MSSCQRRGIKVWRDFSKRLGVALQQKAVCEHTLLSVPFLAVLAVNRV